MYLLEKDCVLLKAKTKFNHNLYQCSTPYEKMVIEESNQVYIKFVYSWLDPVRVREKIISKDQRSMVIVYFLKNNIFSFFGSSESQMNYVINKFEKIFKMELEKINAFENYSQIISAKLIGIHLIGSHNYQNQSLETTDVKLKVNDIAEATINQYFSEKRITLLTFKVENDMGTNYFYVDKGSVITFPDLMKEDTIYGILEKAFFVI